MTLSIVVIVLAVLAWAFGGGNMAVAVGMLATFCQLLKLRVPANPRQFIRYWRGRLTPSGQIEGRSHNSGRYPHISVQMVEAAYQGIINWRATGRTRPYSSKRDCEHNCPEVRQVLSDTGVTMSTLVRRIKAVHPNFQFKKLRVRWQLTDANKQSRLDICRSLLQSFRTLLHRVVFVDAKTVWMWEEDVYGWVDTTVPNSVEGIKPAYSQGRVIHLKYYAAVNSRLGPVFIKFYTGTTGMTNNHDGHNYQVSLCHEQLGLSLGPHMLQGFFQPGCPFSNLSIKAGDGLIHTHPQYTPPLLLCSLSIETIFPMPFIQ